MIPAVRLLPLLVACWLVACGSPSEFRGVFEESGVAGNNRSHALRLTLYEFSGEVGGHVQFYRLGPGHNPPDNPFFIPETCAWFGPGPRRNDEFLLSAEGIEGLPLVARISRDVAADRLIATFTSSGGLRVRDDAEEAPLPLPTVVVFDRVRGADADTDCVPGEP
ncbi:MAG: hypothetical protein EA398_14980 [Deltaproteobacteria bacterium]|nr:MAG: hypothetical protein EA398_14980 [Deltaproteobacteria bacterium]